MWHHRFYDFGPLPLIALVVLSFWFWWPVGLATLAWIGFGRRAGWQSGRWYNAPPEARTANNTARPSGPWGNGGQANSSWGCWTRPSKPAASGNAAFDEYRAETLRRLEDEQKEFFEYLERLRQARDKAEFDSFMAERRRREMPTV